MLAYQQSHNRDVEARYRPLAGPFDDSERDLFQLVAGFLQATGARILTVGERQGVSIYRLRSECETLEDTAHRLRRRNPAVRHNQQPQPS